MDDSVDPGAAPGAAAEGSLPPRKRLLLKSNSSEQGTATPPPGAAAQKMESSPPDPLDPSNPSAVAATGDSCSRCGSKDNSIWRRVKKAGVYQRLCNTCTLLYTMNMYCPYCLVVYQDAQFGDPHLWLNCAHCKRSVHVACEAKNSPGGVSDPATYACPECRKAPNGNNNNNTTNNKPAEETITTNAGSPTSKKPRLIKAEGGEPGNVEGEAPEVKTGGVPPTPKTSAAAAAQEALQAAKAAALQASKAAAQAKATALAKAQAAAKAAMAAKAALDAAAQAARDEIEARAELRRNGVRLEPRGYQALAAAKLDAGETKGKEELGPGDEELARQLHRAMNSSPRNSRGGRRRGSPGASPSDVKEEPRTKDEEGQSMLEGGAVDTQGFPSTYLTDGGNSFPFDILAGFPSHEIQAGVIPGVTGVIGAGGGATAAMEIDPSSSSTAENKGEGGEKKVEVGEMAIPPELPVDKGDTDVSFFGAPDPKFEIPGKWSEDVKPEDEEKQEQQIAVDDYTMEEATPVVAEEMKIDEPVEVNQDVGVEQLQGTQTAIASEAPEAEVKVGTAVASDKDLTV